MGNELNPYPNAPLHSSGKLAGGVASVSGGIGAAVYIIVSRACGDDKELAGAITTLLIFAWGVAVAWAKKAYNDRRAMNGA